MDFDITILELDFKLKPGGERVLPFRDGCCVERLGFNRFIDSHYVLEMSFERNIASMYIDKSIHEINHCMVLKIDFFPEIPSNPELVEKSGGNLTEAYTVPIGEFVDGMYRFVYDRHTPIVPKDELLAGSKSNLETYTPALRKHLFKPLKSARLTSHRAHIRPINKKTIRFDENGRQKILIDSIRKSQTLRPKQKMVVRPTPYKGEEQSE